MPLRAVPADRLTGPGKGLTSADAEALRLRFGSNDVMVEAASTWKTLLRDTVRDPMLWFLVGMSLLFALLGDMLEAVVLGLALIPLVGMDAWLHRRTQASTTGLASRLAAQAVVVRDGAAITLPARELVPGDLVEVAAGTSFPADGLVTAGEDLQVDESSLTGEAFPVRKAALAGLPGDAVDTVHWGFAGTRLLTGRARVRIVQTGGETLYGAIVRSAVIGAHERTPLQVAVARLVTIMLGAALAMCIALAAIRLWQGFGLIDALMSAATLAIAALPEEFPVVFTFFLGVGVYRLARRQALVRRGVAVENIGRVTCIASDKTGTLTEGRLTLSHHWAAAGISDADLLGWAATAARPDSGDPLDMAIIAAGPAPAGRVRLATFAFTEDRRRETAIVQTGDTRTAVMKGAPETVLALCDGDDTARTIWRAQVDGHAARGRKVIAIALHPLNADTATEPVAGYTLLGLVALEDPVREGVREAVQACRAAGIRVIMVTGDHPATAGAIGGDIGLGDGAPVVVLADALMGSDGVLDVRDIDVVARAAPAQKLALVKALQAAGEIVAVTGDGVNDVPALQTADIGIAMGERGTQSAREVASIVLLDDNFRTIVGAIAEGRQLFRNLQLAFAYLLLVHIPLVVSAAAVPLAGYPLLFLPIHIVWLELIIHPTALLVFQELPSSGRLMPVTRHRETQFFGIRTWSLLVLSGGCIAAAIFYGYSHGLGIAVEVERARSIGVGMLVAASAGATAALSGLATRTARAIFAAGIASLLLFAQVPPLATALELRPLSLSDWAMVAGAGAMAAAFALAVKAAIRRPVDGAV